MIKRDISYIFKRIIIGIGIILGISFIRSCNVYALEDTTNMELFYHYIVSPNSSTNRKEYNLYYDNENSRIYATCLGASNHGITYEDSLYINDDFKYLFFYNNNGVLNGQLQLYNKQPYICNAGGSDRFCADLNYQKYNIDLTCSYGKVINDKTVKTISNQSNSFSYNSSWNYSHNFDLKDSSNNLIQEKNLDINLGVQIPEIISLNATLNKTDDNMLVSVSFSPEFSFIDTENYNYYAWFEGYDKLKIEENNVQLNTQSNTTLYVEITDKNGNSIDTETYTVSSIGLIYNGSYDIQFLTTEYSQSDTENNSDQIYDTINRIDIDMLYIPKWVNYKYQYQYVSENGSLTDNWNLINDNTDNNNYVYTATTNGTMYSRILDSNNNVLYTETYSITRIGQIKTFDKNTDKFYGMFNVIKESLNFGGPISDLIVIPVNVLQAIANASNKVCTSYDLGSLWGHHIVLPCIEPEQYLGSALWTTIDLIFSGCMFFAISKWFTSAYYKFILLDNTPGIKERRDLD